MAYHWIEVNKESYESFCRTDITTKEEFDIIASCSTITHIQDNTRLRTIFDLFYQALALAKHNKFNYFSANFLVVTLDIELTRIMDFGRESYISNPNRLVDCKSAYDKFCARMDEENALKNIPVDAMKKITYFYVEYFLKVCAAYCYVLHEIPKDRLEKRRLRVQTPCIPKPLSLFKKT